MMIKTDYKGIFSLCEAEIKGIDPDLIRVLDFWDSKSDYLTVNTSGSTGKPKSIKLKREYIINSATATLRYFELKKGSSFLCCMPFKYIGGIMMLIRALVNEGVIFLEKPSRNPLQQLEKQIDLGAMSTSQTRNAMLKMKKTALIKNLIIGGGDLTNEDDLNLSKLKTACFHSFGMTETISHIALRRIDSSIKNKQYKCLDHVHVSTNKKGQLMIKSKEIGIESIVTNDIVEITGYQQFRYLGRLDNVINSGGLKIHPEQVEETMSQLLDSSQFFIDKEPHKELGELCIMICKKTYDENLIKASLKNFQSRKYAPKKVYWVDEIYFNSNHKIDRIKTKKEAFLINNYKRLSSIM